MFLWPATLLCLAALGIVSAGAIAQRPVTGWAARMLLLAVGLAAVGVFSSGMAGICRAEAVDMGTNLSYSGEQFQVGHLKDSRGWETASAVLTAAGLVSSFIGALAWAGGPSRSGRKLAAGGTQ